LMEPAIAINDLAFLAEQFHRIAGRCGQMGLKEFAKECRTVERNIRKNDVEIQSIVEAYEVLKRFVAQNDNV